MNWLDNLVDQHRELESPSQFWWWSALSAISATLKDNVWLVRGGVFNTYPNIYVMLHAKSGMKKGPPINLAKQLVKPTDVKIITGRSSIQGILKKLGHTYTQPGGKVVRNSAAFICSSELTSSIVDDPVATKLLTDLYDRNYNQGDWESLLKSETFNIESPTISMLTATNDAMSEDFFNKSAIQGGYIARTFIIYAAERQTINSLIYNLHSPPDYVASSNYLKELGKLRGPFTAMAAFEPSDGYKYRAIKHGREIYFNETGIMYDEWYENFTRQVGEQEVTDDTGTLNRFGDSVLKVAMLLSLAREPKLEIIPEAMDEAIKACEKLVINIKRTTLGKVGISSSAQFKTLIILELLNRVPHRATRSVLMNKFWMHFSSTQEFDETMETLHSSKYLQIESEGTQIVYTLSEDRVAEFQTFTKKRGV